jgi:formiminotetrahydrofolate cyclodeaminase
MLNELRVGELLAALGERTPTPASGAATALTGALAAALVELEGAVARVRALQARLVELADEDAVAYTAFMADRSDATRARIIEVPEEIAAQADEVASIAESVRAQLTSSVAGDAEAAVELARTAAKIARRLAELNA